MPTIFPILGWLALTPKIESKGYRIRPICLSRFRGVKLSLLGQSHSYLVLQNKVSAKKGQPRTAGNRPLTMNGNNGAIAVSASYNPLFPPISRTNHPHNLMGFLYRGAGKEKIYE